MRKGQRNEKLYGLREEAARASVQAAEVSGCVFGVSRSDIVGTPGRQGSRQLHDARAVAQLIAHMDGHAKQHIADAFGRTWDATNKAIKKARDLIATDPVFRDHYNKAVALWNEMGAA